MKKHSGNVVYVGLMTALFGLLVMGAVNAATGLLLGASAGDRILGIAQTASDLSIALLALGVLIFGFGLYMRTGSD